jgi:Ca2+-binding EF-hand superfamily protein
MTIYDEDGDGVITKEELLKFAITKAKAEGRGSDDQIRQIEEVVHKLVEYIDSNSDGILSKEARLQSIYLVSDLF